MKKQRIILGLILGTFLSVPAVRVEAQTVTYRYIRNRVSSLCLGVRGVDNHRAGTGAEVYYCDPPGSDQGRDNQWYYQPTGSGYYYIRNRVSGLCLGVKGVDNHRAGTGAEVYYCDPPGSDQGRDNQWYFRPAASGYSYIQNRVSGLCLGVRGVGNHRAGTEAEVYYCDPPGSDQGRDNQWYIRGV